jgi:hypothetical protein
MDIIGNAKWAANGVWDAGAYVVNNTVSFIGDPGAEGALFGALAGCAVTAMATNYGLTALQVLPKNWAEVQVGSDYTASALAKAFDYTVKFAPAIFGAGLGYNIAETYCDPHHEVAVCGAVVHPCDVA